MDFLKPKKNNGIKQQSDRLFINNILKVLKTYHVFFYFLTFPYLK